MEYGDIIYCLTTLTMHSNITIMYSFIYFIFPFITWTIIFAYYI